jgi:hypothetical protein
VVTGLLQYHYKAGEPPCCGSGCKGCHRHDLTIQF